jgi:beta-N-acetylhexosaminidase
MIMTGHLFNSRLDPQLPASLSHSVVTGLLREELGWQGVVISDDLQMEAVQSRFSQREAVRLAVLAGTDILLSGNNLAYSPTERRTLHKLLLDLVEKGEISRERIAESWARIRSLKLLLPSPYPCRAR